MEAAVYVLLAALLLGIYAITDLPIVLSPAGTCHTVLGKYLPVGISALLFLGLALSRPFASPVPCLDALTVCLAAVFVLLLLRPFFKEVSIVFALFGAASGIRLFRGTVPSVQWSVPLSWLAAAVLTGLLSMLLYALLLWSRSWQRSPFLSHLKRMGDAISVVSGFLLVAVGLNLGRGIPSVLSIRDELLLAALLVGGIAFLARSSVEAVSGRYMERIFDINPESALSITVSIFLVLTLFSFDGIFPALRLKATVLSPGLLALAGLVGCRISQGRSVNWASVVSKAGADMLLTPVFALVVSYLLACLFHPESFKMQGTLILALTMLLLLAVAILLAFMFHHFRVASSSGRTLRERENELNANRRAISELELKTMQVENENLHNLLQRKRQELVSVAMNINEQKEFIRDIYEQVGLARWEKDVEKKNALLHDIQVGLNLRMNFSNEIDSFYAQVEQLHKDFTTRMAEKFPNLTKQERRLTILLRLGFSTKYIATLMNIAPASVEISRHRLRAKMGLSRNQNLTDFIKTI